MVRHVPTRPPTLRLFRQSTSLLLNNTTTRQQNRGFRLSSSRSRLWSERLRERGGREGERERRVWMVCAIAEPVHWNGFSLDLGPLRRHQARLLLLPWFDGLFPSLPPPSLPPSSRFLSLIHLCVVQLLFVDFPRTSFSDFMVVMTFVCVSIGLILGNLCWSEC